MCLALGMEEGALELDVGKVKEGILLSTWVGCPLVDAVFEPVEAAPQTLGGCVRTGEEVYAGGSVSVWQNCDFASDWA